MDLLKEAIAEAKAVKSIAEQNAMDFLKEKLAEEVRSGIISTKLREEDDEETSDEVESMPPTDSVETPSVDDAPVEGDESEENYDDELDEILRELEGDTEDPEMEMEEETEDPENAEISDDELDEIIREAEDEMADDEVMEEACEDDEKEEPKMEVRKLNKKLAEANKVIAAQRKTINEVGLLSAKLLYSNKILGKYNLSESNKIKVLEAFDRAKNLREAKLTYVTLIDSFKSTSKPSRVVESASKPSKAVGKITKPVLTESTDTPIVERSRWQMLAGIKN